MSHALWLAEHFPSNLCVCVGLLKSYVVVVKPCGVAFVSSFCCVLCIHVAKFLFLLECIAMYLNLTLITFGYRQWLKLHTLWPVLNIQYWLYCMLNTVWNDPPMQVTIK